MNTIRKLRKQRKMTQKELAVHLGVADSTLSNWEIGKHEPDYESLRKLAGFFNVSVDCLLDYNKTPDNSIRRTADTDNQENSISGYSSNVSEAIPKYSEYYTYADYCSWGGGNEKGYWELINGAAYFIFTPTLYHQTVSKKLFRQIDKYLDDKPCEAFYSPVSVRLNADTADDTVLIPDILVVCDEIKLSDGRGVVGSPDLVVEILSPSTASHDWIVKFEQYQKYGVKEYWIVDPRNNMMVANTLENGKYVSKTYESNETSVPVSVLNGCFINLSEVFS